VLLRREHLEARETSDSLVIAFVLVSSLSYILLWRTMGAVINKVGGALDVLAGYFLARILIRTREEVERVIKLWFTIGVFITICMTLEATTGRNVFSIFGGVSEYSFVREGRIRAQAVFPHPVLAGSFGASLFPLAWALRRSGKNGWVWCSLGAAVSVAMVGLSASSGPIMSLLGGLLGLLLWRMRYKMRFVTRGILVMLGLLQILMKSPIWSLLYRVSIVGGSDAWHRFALVDQAIRRFPEWALLGTTSTSRWGWGLEDVTNQYVRVGVDGGVLSLLLFLVLLGACLKGLGRKIRAAPDASSQQRFYWYLAVAFWTHLLSFVGTSYFSQMGAFLWLFLGMIAGLGKPRESTEGDEVPTPAAGDTLTTA
jgi:hypothetical protein